MVTKEYLQDLTRPELSAYCRNHGIKGYSGKTKADRIKLILSYESGKQTEGKQKFVKQPKRKSTKKLKLYLYGDSIRSEGIGDVDYVIVTTSKRNAIVRILKVDTKRAGANWISQRMSIEDDVGYLFPNLKKIKGFNPWNTPEILYMVETDKMEGNLISWRKIPVIVKKWGPSGESILRKEYVKKEIKKISVKKTKPGKTRGQFLLEEMKDDLDYWKPYPFKYEYGEKYSAKKTYDINLDNGSVEVDYRDLVGWDYEDGWKDYIKRFKQWAKDQDWSKKVEPEVIEQEKGWVTFKLKLK